MKPWDYLRDLGVYRHLVAFYRQSDSRLNGRNLVRRNREQGYNSAANGDPQETAGTLNRNRRPSNFGRPCYLVGLVAGEPKRTHPLN